MMCNSRSTCTSHTGCFAWRGRGRACWRSPRAGKLSRCTCRFWPKPSGLQGSWADHLEGVRLWGRRYDDGWRGGAQHSIAQWNKVFVRRVLPTGAFRTALQRFSHRVSARQRGTLDRATFHMACLDDEGGMWSKKKVTVSQVNANKVASNTNHLLQHIS